MGTVIIGGGPRPGAAIYSVTRVVTDEQKGEQTTYEIRDGSEIVARFERLSFAQALLPLIQRGE